MASHLNIYEFAEHFENMAKNNQEPFPQNEFQTTVCDLEVAELDYLFTEEEICKTTSDLTKNKSSGIDNIVADLFRL